MWVYAITPIFGRIREFAFCGLLFITSVFVFGLELILELEIGISINVNYVCCESIAALGLNIGTWKVLEFWFVPVVWDWFERGFNDWAELLGEIEEVLEVVLVVVSIVVGLEFEFEFEL